MKKISNVIVGKISGITGETISIERKKYSLNDVMKGRISKMDPEKVKDATVAIILDKEDKVAGLNFRGVFTAKAEIKKFNSDETYKADFAVILGRVCSYKEAEKVITFTIPVEKGPKEDRKTEWYSCKIFKGSDDLATRAAVELVVPEGEPKPQIWAIARKQVKDGYESYAVTDFGLI